MKNRSAGGGRNESPGWLRLAGVGGMAAVLALAAGRPAVAGPPPFVDLELVSAETAEDSQSQKILEVQCPAGKVPVSGGAVVDGGSALLQTMPVGSPPTGWSGVGRGSGDWKLSVHAWCAQEPPGFEIVAEISPLTQGAEKTIFSQCPAGKRLIGGGGGVFFSADFGALSELRIDGDRMIVSGADLDETGNWFLRSDAVCATGSRLDRIGAEFFTFSQDSAVLKLICPDDQVALLGAVGTDDDVTLGILGSWPENQTDWFAVTQRAPGLGASSRIQALCAELPLFFDGFETGDASAWQPGP